jgi:hypothetical protein
VWPVIAGVLTGFLVMMVFEYINSFFYSLPQDLDWNNTEAVQAFTATLPWTAYILVFSGWVAGSSVAGYFTVYISREPRYALAVVTGGVLVLLGLLNNLMLGQGVLFNVFSLPLFVIGTYGGYRYAARRRTMPHTLS